MCVCVAVATDPINTTISPPSPSPPDRAKPFPTASQLRARIPPAGGIHMVDLLKCFEGQLVGAERKGRFLRLVRGNTRYDLETKALYPK